jgi:PAS domain S-box-containing protein
MNTGSRNNVSFFKSLFESGENSESFEQKIADFFPAIIYVYDQDKKRLRFINKKLTDFLGYSYEDVEQWDNDFMKVVFEDDVSLVQKELDRFNSLADDDTYSYNSRLIHKQGDWKYFRTHGTVLKRNKDGNPASLLFIAQDITDQLQTEEEASGSKDLLNETEALLHFGTWTWDVVTDKVLWSKGLYNLMGYDDHTPVGNLSKRSFVQHIAKKDATDFDTAIENSLKTKTGFQIISTIITKDEKQKIVSTLAKVITSSSGDVTKILGVTHDVTEQILLNREQQELKDSLWDYKDAMIDKERLLEFGSLEMNLLTHEQHWSDGMYLLFGYDPATDKGKVKFDDHFYNSHMTRADLDQARKELSQALENRDNYIIETTIQTKTGIVKRLETYGRIERNAHKKPVKIVGISRNITRLRDYETNLQHKIEELNRSNKELEEFAYIASHDLQEPLRKITAFSERLQEKAGNEMGHDGQLYLQRILAATKNMGQLIDNLLEFSRTTRHNDSLQNIDLNIVFEEVLADLELKIEETNARVQHSPLPVITTYHSQMKQLFTNLLSNAIKFRKPDAPPSIQVWSEEVSEKEKHQHLLRADKKYYKIVVSDSGIGFEQGYALKIFQIFQRLHGKAEYPGSGIGLSICKKIVENHNGVIYAEGTPGKGATFTTILPENNH